MVDLSLALLGTFTAVYDERLLTHFRTKAVQALLIYLVCQPELHAREALMTLLWPELPTKSAQGNLRHVLYHLRQAIPKVNGINNEEVAFVLAERQTIQVNPNGRFWLDIPQFETLADSQAVGDWQTAVALYRDDFLSDFYLPDSSEFESWVQSRRAALRRRLLDTLTKLTAHYLEEGDFEEAEQYARRQLTIDNLREEAHRQLMLVLARNGRRTDALAHYQSLCQLLRDELGIAPSADTETLVEAIRGDRLKGVTGREEPYAVPHNLPPHATPFIGRQAELAVLDELLSDSQTRMVTILGIGGIGKTRLSLAVAERQLTTQKFAQGVFFVSLAGLNESDRIVPAIAEAIRIRLEKGESQLFNYLRTKQILLVLDNFEHLLDGSDLVSRLLQAAPQLQILVTSRERLRLQGEQVFPIEGLMVNETAVSDDARTLFVQAARRLQPDFAATAANLPALNQICRLVEGMPLALELAAAWVDMFTLEDIAAEVQRNLEFLESDLRDMPARHRSMQAVFDTSWQQLSDNLQQVLAAIGVFRGGFTREAATAVAQASLRDLVTLANKSLIRFDADDNRYHIHELLRQYSLARLAETAVHDNHAAYYLDWLVQQAPKLTSEEQTTTIAQIKNEMDNIRVAINRALQQQRLDNFVPVIRALGRYYGYQLHSTEAISLFDHILAQLATIPGAPSRILFWVIAWQVKALGAVGQKTKANELWAVGKNHLVNLTLQDNDSRAEQAFAAYIQGYDLYMERPNEAQRLLQKSYELATVLGDSWLAGHVSRVMGLAARNQGDLAAAEAAASRSISLFKTLHDRRNIVSAQILLGDAAGIDGRYEEAEQQLSAAVAMARQDRLPPLEYALSKLSMVYFFSGQFQKARTSLAEDRLLSEKSDFTWGIVRSDINLGLLHLHGDGNYLEALKKAQKALQMGREIGVDFFVCEALVLLTQVDIALEKYESAQERLRAGDRPCVSRPIGSLYVAGNDLYWGIVKATLGQTAVAHQHLYTELETAVQRQNKLNLANALAAIALLHALENQAAIALELYTVAQQHPFVANSRWFADVVGKRVTAVAQNLSPATVAAAQARGSALDMWETAESICKSFAP